MEDVSDVFKRGFLALHKKTTVGQSLQIRKDFHNNVRKEKRNVLAYNHRNIDENMTPINTPDPKTHKKMETKKREDTMVEDKANKRLDMLIKWKAEKEKKRQEAKLKAKPVFKVCHVSVGLGVADLENVNKVIKGKPMRHGSNAQLSKFAPDGHKFKPPNNILPVNLNFNAQNVNIHRKSSENISKKKQTTATNCNTRKPVTRSTTKVESTNMPKGVGKVDNTVKSSPSKKTKQRTQEIHEPRLNKTTTKQKTTTAKTNLAGSVGTTIEKHKNATSNTKQIISKSSKTTNKSPMTTSEKNTVNSSPEYVNTAKENAVKKTPKKPKNKSRSDTVEASKIEKTSDTESNPGIEKELPSEKACRKKSTIKTPKKSVVWNVVEVVDSDDEVFVSDTAPKTPNNKMYRKTPKKKTNPQESSDSYLEESNTDSPQYNNSLTRQGNKESEKVSIKSASPDYPISSTDGGDTTKDVIDTPVSSSTNASIYISPFVTISRGKNNARKEYEIRRSHGGSLPETPNYGKKIASYTSPKAGADYFSRKLDSEINRIEDLCDEWQKFREDPELPEEAYDSIDVTIGQSKLLISKKFQQFRDLINQCRNQEYKEKLITCEDLHGFWDMMYVQVEDLDKRFNNLQNLKNNNWQEIVPSRAAPVPKKPRGRPKKVKGVSKFKDFIKAARQNKLTGNTDLPTTPKEPSSAKRDRTSLRVSTLASEARKRCSSSPGLAMMKVTQSIKRGDGLTPSKSILKSDLTCSAKKSGKSVLFKENLEEINESVITKVVLFKEDEFSDKENVCNNLIVSKSESTEASNLIAFSPMTPTRRSTRLGCKTKK